MKRREKTQSVLEELFPEQEVAATAPAAEPSGQEDTVDVPVEERQPGVITTPYTPHGSHIDVLCEPSQVVAVAQRLDAEGYFIESIAGVDWLKEERMEVVYDYTCYDHDQCRVTVRTFIPRSNPVVPTISPVFPGANWHERETFDFYGIIFEGHPDLTRILLPEDADFYPLRKDYMP